ncbi:MAG: GxxExxY protein [Prevotella sp.]|nr:GxxExxY protein [Prevotella sp.]
MMNDRRDDRTYEIIGAAMEVHRHLGGGFLEVVYGDALEMEFQERGIPYQREKDLQIYYKDKVLPHFYKADFICYDSIVVELKAVENLTVESQAQVINYLAATGCKVGLLLNFGRRSLEKRRFVF